MGDGHLQKFIAGDVFFHHMVGDQERKQVGNNFMCALADLYSHSPDDLQLPADEYHAAATAYDHAWHLHVFGPAMEHEELDEMASLLGQRPSSITEGNFKLEQRVREADSNIDEALIRYFYRYARRKKLILRDAVFSQGDQGKTATLQLLPKF